ncbi:MAG: hypothetical protein PHW59_12895, partial [Desulfobacterales bacterium]|nr:hypothetical protein [Desulfobacterales bacterium]
MDLSFLQDKQYLDLDEPTRREVFNRMVSSQAETESEEFSTLDDDTRSAVLDYYWNNAPQAEPEPEQGFFSNVLDLAGSGFQKLKTGMPLAADVAGGEFSDDAPEAIHSLLTENGPQPKELKSAVENLSKIGADWEEAKGFMESAGVVGRGMLAIAKEAVTNPKGLAYISAEQVANMAPSIAGMLAGGKLGALGGTAAPVTVPVGAFLGGMAGGAAVEMAIETAGFVDDALQELGLDATEENIRALLSDPDEAEKIISQSRKKAAGTAATDAALTLIGGKIAISGGRGISRMSRAGRIAGGAAVDIAGEGISEAAGQKWSKGKVDMGDVALETFAGVGGAAPSLAGAARALGGVGEEKDTGGGSDVPPVPEQVQARLAAIEEGLYSGDIDLETLGRLDLPKLGLNPDDIDRIVTGFQKSLRDEQAAEGMADIGKAGTVDEAIDAAARATGIISREMDPASPEAGVKLREDLASRELDGLRQQWPGVSDDRLHEIDSAYQAARRSEAGIEAFRKKYGLYALGLPPAERSARDFPAERSARVFMEGDVQEEDRIRTKAELEPDINKFLRRDEQHLAGSGVEIEPGETDAQDRISIPGELSLNQLVDQAKERLKGVDSKAAIALAKPILDQVKRHGAQQDIIEKSKRAARDFPELQKVFGEIIKPADTTQGTLERDLEKAEKLLAEDPSSRTRQALVDHRRKKLERYGKKPAM